MGPMQSTGSGQCFVQKELELTQTSSLPKMLKKTCAIQTVDEENPKLPWDFSAREDDDK